MSTPHRPASGPASTPSLEAQVVRLGLMTPDEVATTMREEAETGRPFAELAVESGRLREEDLARVTGEPRPVEAVAEPLERAPVAAVPDPEPLEPEAPIGVEDDTLSPLEAAPEADPPEPTFLQPAATPAPTTVGEAEVFVRLTSGERIGAGRFADQDAAEGRARELMDALDGSGEWPRLDGRFIRPDAVVSIDVELPQD